MTMITLEMKNLQCDINSEAARISALSSEKIDHLVNHLKNK